ncbi:MAG: TIGR02281 family clan AA aspartic protease [Paracoccaceae bacterium]
MDGDTLARLGYLGLLMAAVGGWVIVEFRGRFGQALRTAAAWGLIVVGLMAGYGLWQDMRTDILPRQTVVEGGEIRLPRAADGHYYLTLSVSGTNVPFMVDTGASQVVLTMADARRVGIDPASLMFLGEARTANGVVRTARVTVSDVQLGPHRDDRLTVFVNEGDLDISLLGMTYLGRYRIEIADGEMILRR